MVTSSAGLSGSNHNNNGTFDNIGNNDNWWGSTENNTTNAWNRNLNYNNDNVNKNNNNKGSLLFSSVRNNYQIHD
ncbi:MAG: hypothetical protein P1U56_25090 [Saprospiraceae bacterium]|nr:hypothetical protein [Saprospiraceae bacterium]